MKRKTADVSYYLHGKREKIAESPPVVLDFLIDLTEEYGGTIANVYRRSKEKYSCPDAWSILEKYIENGCGENLAKYFFYEEQWEYVRQGVYREIHTGKCWIVPNVLPIEEREEYFKRKAEKKRRRKRNEKCTN